MSNDGNDDLRMLGMVGRRGAGPGFGIANMAIQPPTDDERAKLAGYGIKVDELGRTIITNSIAGVSSEVDEAPALRKVADLDFTQMGREDFDRLGFSLRDDVHLAGGEGVKFEDPPPADARPGPKPDSCPDTDGGTGARKVLAGEGELTMDGGSYRLKGTITGDPKVCLPEVKLQGASPCDRDCEEHPILGAVRELLEAGETISGLQVIRGGRRVLLGMRVAWEEEGD